jgi:hypothetical protein
VNASEQPSTLLITADLRHKSVSLKGLVDAGKYHQFAMFIELLEGLLVD